MIFTYTNRQAIIKKVIKIFVSFSGHYGSSRIRGTDWLTGATGKEMQFNLLLVKFE